MAIQPVTIPGAGARGAGALKPTPLDVQAAIKSGTTPAPKAGSPGWKAFTANRWAANHPNAGQGSGSGSTQGDGGLGAPKVTPDQAATNSAMAAFQTALAQLKASTPPVDAAAIHAPYTASEAVTGQLGTGYQQAQQNAGAAASQQYTQGLNDAQKAAASFGISAGAGANPTQLQNTGTAPLASQTLANSASAAAGVQQWQQLLEKAAADKVSGATVARDQGLTSATQGLSATIPQAIMNEKTLANQQASSRANNAYLRASLTAKGQAQYDANVLRQEGINAGITKAKIQQTGANSRSSASINAANARSAASITAAGQRQAKALAAAQKKATVAGIKGVSQANSLLKPSASTKGAYRGWDVAVQPMNADGTPKGPVQKNFHGPTKTWAPPGYRNVGGATPHFDKNAPAGGTAGVSLATWNRALAILKTSNPGTPVGQLLPIIGPKPAK